MSGIMPKFKLGSANKHTASAPAHEDSECDSSYASARQVTRKNFGYFGDKLSAK
jgi:hypothetical protein